MSNNRRSFLKKLAGGAIGAALSPSILKASEAQVAELEVLNRDFSSNDRIRLAGIGMGIQGFANMRTAVQVPGVELVAVCDLYDGHLVHAKEVFGSHLATTRDYREILKRSDIDAVCIATPDHWHEQIAVEALQAGKAVYCEKPMVQHLEQGHAIIEAQKKSGKAFQVGSQRVSSIVTWKAKELYEQGVIGQLVMVEANYDRQSANGAWQYSIPTDASPETLDWDRFLGSAPKRPFDPVRFFRWRNYRDYGTGMAGDLYVHLFSALHTVLSSKGPERIFATGGLRYWKDGRDVPDVQIAVLDYPETKAHPAFNMQLRCNFVDGKGGGSAVRLIGSEGIIEVGGGDVKVERHVMSSRVGYGGWDTYNTFSEAQQKEYEAWYKAQYPLPENRIVEPDQMVYRVPEGYSDHLEHWANFFAAIRQGKPAYEDAVFGLRAAGPSLAANVSYFGNKQVRWDAEAMKVV
ncbi:MAG: Gfo/Idh/MocA family oxidoreductase [Phaeodactylibacter sp.]|nr:Gfo/Idh/MocA family oxidoreductase [Phaeodactylibacter sp.]MCB9274160.1 Gfo/Idh/MocA family oxidoreductase [Lewinellaceae bacterium]